MVNIGRGSTFPYFLEDILSDVPIQVQERDRDPESPSTLAPCAPAVCLNHVWIYVTLWEHIWMPSTIAWGLG
jgi:hypothetical protein